MTKLIYVREHAKPQDASSSRGSGSKNSGPTTSLPFNTPSLLRPLSLAAGTKRTKGSLPRAMMISSPKHALSMSRERLALASRMPTVFVAVCQASI